MRTVATLAGIAALLAFAAPAGAQSVALLDTPRGQDVALSGREVLVGGTRAHARVTVDAVNIVTGARRRVLAAPSPGRGWTASVQMAASAQRIAVLAAYEDDEGYARHVRLYAGPPSGPLAPALLARYEPDAWLPITIDVDGDRLLVVEVRLSDHRSRARVLPPAGAAFEVPWPGLLTGPAQLAGDLIAFVGAPHTNVEGPIEDLIVADWRSGAVTATLDIDDPDNVRGGDLDLAADGRLAAAVGGRLLGSGGTPLAPGRRWSAPRLAGARIAALRGVRFGAARPYVVDAGAARPLGPASTTVGTPVADERGAAWLSRRRPPA